MFDETKNVSNVDSNATETINNLTSDNDTIEKERKDEKDLDLTKTSENVVTAINAVKNIKETETAKTSVIYNLEMYARELELDESYLKNSLYLDTNKDETAVEITYYDETGKLLNIKQYNHQQIKWDNEKIPEIYGLWLSNQFAANYVILVSTEQQCQILWSKGVQALGVCNDIKISKDMSINFSKYKRIYIQDDLIEKCSNLPKEKIYVFKKKDISLDNIKKLFTQKGNFNFERLNALSKKLSKDSIEININKEAHVLIGEELIEQLHLKCYNNKIYAYANNVYTIADDEFLSSYIIRKIDINAKKPFIKNIINFVHAWLNSNQTIDVNTDYINFKNGLFCISSKQLIKHTSEIFTINQLHVNYLENLEKNNVVDDYVAEIMCNNEARINGFLEILGYCMTSKTDAQKFFIFLGSGQNGKSVATDKIKKIVGTENVSHVELQVFEKRFGSHEIEQKLLNLVSDLPFTAIKDVSIFKGVVTGDEFNADVKYQNRIKIKPYAKHIFTTNKLPQISDTTDGFYRRINILIFENKFEIGNEEYLKELDKQENLDYLANISLRAFLKVLKSKNLQFSNEAESSLLVNDYKRRNDTIEGFLTDEEYSTLLVNCSIDNANNTLKIATTTFYNLYKNFCADNKLKALGKIEFFKKLIDYRWKKVILNGTYYFEKI